MKANLTVDYMNTFNKEITAQMKTIALLLMLVHHLWNTENITLYGSNLSGVNIYIAVSAFAKICVGIFMFISGYGLMASYTKGTFRLGDRLRKTILPFWFILFISICFLSFMRTVSPWEIVDNALLLSSSLNGDWWFMQTYVVYILLFPLFGHSVQQKWVWIPLYITSLIAFQPIAFWIRPYNGEIHYALHYFPILYSGMIFQHFKIFERLMERPYCVRWCLVLVAVFIRFSTGWAVLNIVLIASLGVMLIDINNIISMPSKVFNFLGVMSMNMWLLHHFVINYGLPFWHPISDLAILYAETLFIAYILYKMYQCIMNKIV